MATEISSYRFFKDLTALPFIEKIYLFGSRAKGLHEDRADIDLAILCPLASDLEWDKVLKIIEEADTLLKIDCVRYDKIKNEKFLNAIMKNHIVLYEGTKRK
jgi:predicted nucleotidyltransferase